MAGRFAMRRSVVNRILIGSITGASLYACVDWYRVRRPSSTHEDTIPCDMSIDASMSPGGVLSPPPVSEKEKHDDEFNRVAECFSKDLVFETFKDEEVMNALIRLLLKTFKTQKVKGALIKFFKHQFTEDPETVAALNKFLLQELISDPWVKEQLLQMAVELGENLIGDPSVYPGWDEGLMKMLGDTSWQALGTHEFLDGAKTALVAGALHVRSPPSLASRK